MMSTWMLYAVLVTLLLSVGAWALERALRDHRVPARWIWAAALAGSCLLPVMALVAPGAPPAPVASAADLPAELDGGAIATDAAAPSLPAFSGTFAPANISALAPVRWRLPALPAMPARFDPLAVGGWLLISLALALMLLHALRALVRARRGWSMERVDGREVLVSEGMGPALVGVLRPAIVMPRWALALSPQDRELVLLHEEEHRRAGDAPLMLVALLFLVLVPWNLPLWWQLRRLRLAVEIDCDRRVLRGTGELRRYVSLLVEMGRRRSHPVLSIALAEPASFLERRIRTMTTRPKPRYVRTVGMLLAAVLFIAAAGEVEQPVVQERPAAPVVSAEVDAEPVANVDADVGVPADLEVDVASAAKEVSVPQPVAAEVVLSDAVPQLEAAQIRGRVSDAATGVPLADARVFLVGTNLVAVSASSGNYAMTDVPAGTHELRVERVGYTTATRVVALSDNAVLETDFALTGTSPAVVARADLPTIPVTSRISGRVTDVNSGAPMADVQVYLVGANIGAITRQNGAFIILNVPPGTYIMRAERIGLTTAAREITVTAGAAVEENFQLGMQPLEADTPTRIRLRDGTVVGGPIIFIDGVRIRPPADPGGPDFLSTLPPAEIERIEVTKGAAAVGAYGPEAAAGVIQIFRKKPQGPAGASSSDRPAVANPLADLDPQTLEYLRTLGMPGSA